MGQPTPPGDIPLYEGLGSEWNEVLSSVPEAQRATIGSTIKNRIDAYEPYKQWDDFQKSGVTPEQAATALHVYNHISTNPREVAETLAGHLNLTLSEAQQLDKAIDEGLEDDPTNKELLQLRQQVDTLSQIMVAENQQKQQAASAAAADKELEKEMTNLRKKVGDFPENVETEILMRMSHLGLDAEKAYEHYTGVISDARKTRPAPMLLGGGGTVPSRAIDPTKLDSVGTKNLVAQMLSHANNEGRQ